MSCLCNLFYKKKKESTLTRIIKGIPQSRSYTLINTTHIDEYEFAPSLLDNTNNNNTLCCLFPHITTKIYKTQIPFSTECIPIIHIHTSIPSKTKHTIIYSHSIRSDIGTVLALLIDLSYMLKSDIISYDYTLPSVQTLLSSTSQYTFIEEKLSTNLEHVLDYVINTLHICKENLILMSHSFGSVPTLYNASSEEFQNIAGIVLVSPMFGYEKASDDDVNTVIPEHSLNFSCNCFVIHGMKDKVVSTRKVEMMCKQIRNCKWTFAEGCGHFDTFCGKERWKVYDKVRQFMNMCESVRCGKGNGNDKGLDSTRVSEVVNVNERISKMKEQQEDDDDESYNDIENNFIM